MEKCALSGWTKDELEDTFGLKQVESDDILTDWLHRAQSEALGEPENVLLPYLRKSLVARADDWNEVELSEYFIGPILSLINFNTNEFSIFSERELSGTVGEYEFSGAPDAMIAKGRRRPKLPYFCFHEYKKENEPRGDPAAQVLAAMLVAQELNQHRHPVYGMVVAGKIWYFMTLKEKDYCISLPYTAVLEDHLIMIVKILKALKEIVRELVKQD